LCRGQRKLKLSRNGQGKLKLSGNGNECKPCPAPHAAGAPHHQNQLVANRARWRRRHRRGILGNPLRLRRRRRFKAVVVMPLLSSLGHGRGIESAEMLCSQNDRDGCGTSRPPRAGGGSRRRADRGCGRSHPCDCHARHNVSLCDVWRRCDECHPEQSDESAGIHVADKQRVARGSSGEVGRIEFRPVGEIKRATARGEEDQKQARACE
jgi:hypothetical protein